MTDILFPARVQDAMNVQAIKINLDNTDFSDPGLTKTFDIGPLLPGDSIVRSVQIYVGQAFDQLTTLTLSVGVAGDLARYVAASNALVSAIYPTVLTGGDLRIVATQLQVTMVGTSLTKVLADMTQGTCTIYILYESY